MRKTVSRVKLEIGQERSLSQAIKRPRVNAFSPLKKFIVMMTIMFIAVVGGLITVTTADMNKANAITVDPISDFLCTNVSNGTAYLGGVSQPIIDNFKGIQGSAPWEGLFGVFSVPMADRTNIDTGKAVQHEWTTVERYGYFATQYTNWVGMQTHYPLERLLDEVFSDGKLPYMGTGGYPGGFGEYVKIVDGSQSPFFSNGIMDCVPFGSHMNITAANLFQGINQAITGTAINFYTLSSNLSLTDEDSVMKPLGDVFQTLIAGDSSKNIKGMKDLLFLDFMFPLIMAGAIVIAVSYTRSGSTLKAAQQVAWILIVTISGMLLLSNPLFISGTVEKVVNSVTGTMSHGILQVGTKYPQCSLGNSEKDNQKVERELGCYIWMENVYRPWVEAQFGMPYDRAMSLNKDPNVVEGLTEAGDPSDADTYTGLNASNWEGINQAAFNSTQLDENGEPITKPYFSALISLGYNPKEFYPDYDKLFDNGKPVARQASEDNTRGVFKSFDPHLGKKAATKDVKNWPYFHMASASNWPVSSGYNHSEVAFNQLAIEQNTTWKNPSDATMSSLISLTFSALPNIAMIILSATLISLQLTLSILIIVAPFFFALGLIPGFGQNIMMKWVNLLTSVTVRRIIVTFFFMLYLRFYFAILGTEMNGFIKVLLAVLISAVILKFKDEMASFISRALQFRSSSGQNVDMSDAESTAYSQANQKAKSAGRSIKNTIKKTARSRKS